jgi:hypothetical protein
VIFRFARLALMCALCVSMGGPWFALQSVAWASMVVKYSQSASLAAAVAQTFDGQHPCSLCKRINAAKPGPEKSPAAQPLTAKVHLMCATGAVVLIPPVRRHVFPSFSPTDCDLTDTPPVPPPRRALV